MSKVIYTAEHARYMVQARETLYRDGWENYESFTDQQDAEAQAARLKRNNPEDDYRVVDMKED